jgi:hypothetical protein
MLPTNDPAPDLLHMTPDGKYLLIAFRGPAPVTVAHSAQGSCPGVGIVELGNGGRSGKLVDIIRTTNTVADSVAVGSIAPNGRQYTGTERSDIHGIYIVPKNDDDDDSFGNFDLLFWPIGFLWSILMSVF